VGTFIVVFVFFLFIISIMAVGYIVQRKRISGSCGGVAALGIDKICDCPEPCDRKKARQEKERIRAEKLREWQDNKII